MKSPVSHLLTASIVFIAVIAGQAYWYSIISKKSADVAELQSQIDVKSRATSRIASSRAVFAEIADDEAAVKNYFVKERDVVAFINDLQARGLSQKSEVKVLSVSSSGSAARSILTFALTITGAFDAVMRTIGTIEYAPYNLSISKFSVAKDGKKTWSANLEMVVSSVPADTNKP